MGRWRPPMPASSAYITREGADALTRELKQLWKVERPKLTQQVHDAAKNGDRSENGDYIYGKRRLAEIDRRVRYLSKRMDEVIVVDRLPDDRSRVFFGAWVTISSDSPYNETVRIVGADETDSGRKWISIDSPMGKVMISRRVGDEIAFETPNGKRNEKIVAISYEIPEQQ